MADTAKLIEAIEAHLATHPLAADSAEGVARSWLAAHGVVASPHDVELALAALVQRRRLRRVQLADGNTLYCSATDERDTQSKRRM